MPLTPALALQCCQRQGVARRRCVGGVAGCRVGGVEGNMAAAALLHYTLSRLLLFYIILQKYPYLLINPFIPLGVGCLGWYN